MDSGKERYYVVSWNVEKYSPAVHEWLTNFLRKQKPDVVLLSETKCRETALAVYFRDFSEEYASIVNAHQPSCYHGVAMLIRKDRKFMELPVENSYDFQIPERTDFEKGTNSKKCATMGRVITIIFERNVVLVGTYVPNSGRSEQKKYEYRVNVWDPALQNYLNDCRESHPVLWIGDMNVAPTTKDVSNPRAMAKYAGFTPAERESFANFMNARAPDGGDLWVDLFRAQHGPEKQRFSWRGKPSSSGTYKSPKDYGLRIDNIIASSSLTCVWKTEDTGMIEDCPLSDHVPVYARFVAK